MITNPAVVPAHNSLSKKESKLINCYKKESTIRLTMRASKLLMPGYHYYICTHTVINLMVVRTATTHAFEVRRHAQNGYLSFFNTIPPRNSKTRWRTCALCLYAYNSTFSLDISTSARTRRIKTFVLLMCLGLHMRLYFCCGHSHCGHSHCCYTFRIENQTKAAGNHRFIACSAGVFRVFTNYLVAV